MGSSSVRFGAPSIGALHPRVGAALAFSTFGAKSFNPQSIQSLRPTPCLVCRTDRLGSQSRRGPRPSGNDAAHDAIVDRQDCPTGTRIRAAGVAAETPAAGTAATADLYGVRRIAESVIEGRSVSAIGDVEAVHPHLVNRVGQH